MTAGVFFFAPKACDIARLPGFSISPWARYRFLCPALWRASRAPPNGEDYELRGFPSFRPAVAIGCRGRTLPPGREAGSISSGSLLEMPRTPAGDRERDRRFYS